MDETLTMTTPSLQRTIGNLEAQVSKLIQEVADMREELTELRTILLRETLTHHERLLSLESFRRWGIGLFTGLAVSGIAALLGAVFRIII